MKVCSLCNNSPASKYSKYNYCWDCRYKKQAQERFGENNPNWKGEKVSYTGIHDYIKWHKPTPKACELCGDTKKVLDLANVSQKYLRDLSDWEWLCRKCHMTKDGRIDRMIKHRKTLRRRQCRVCGNHFMGTMNSVRCSNECIAQAKREYVRRYRERCRMESQKS